MQLDIYDILYEPFKLDTTKPIRLFEAFSGYGSQQMALKRLGLQIEVVGYSEIDKYAIKVYEALHGKHKNYGAIGTFDRLPPNIDICTWSFPCQDISLAGKQQGMKDGTRSNYGYVFLDTVANTPRNERPKVLLMENVRALFSKTFSDDWKEIQLRLEKMGYTNYADILNSKDYGVAQNRERVFIVSILDGGKYDFPKPIPLNKRLKDYLEEEVDEKYYLSDKQIEQIVNWQAYNKPLENAKSEDDETIQTITAKSNTSMNSSMLLIKEATKQGYAIAEDGDGIYINRPHQKRGVVQKDKIQTIKTSVNDIGVVVKETKNYIESNVLGSIDNSRRAWKEDKVIGTITTRSDTSKVLLNYKSFEEKQNEEDGFALLNKHSEIIAKLEEQERKRKELILKIAKDPNLSIRKLTPREALRLMDVDDKDIDIILSLVSNNQAYKLAGNSIVVSVLEHIFRQMI